MKFLACQISCALASFVTTLSQKCLLFNTHAEWWGPAGYLHCRQFLGNFASIFIFIFCWNPFWLHCQKDKLILNRNSLKKKERENSSSTLICRSDDVLKVSLHLSLGFWHY
jgi:hypothetical protein